MKTYTKNNSPSLINSKSFACLLVLFVPIFFACNGGESDQNDKTGEPGAVSQRTETVQSDSVAKISVTEMAPYGQYLVDANGRALYLFTPDKKGQGSNCYDKCAEAWPPFLTAEDTVAAASMVNTEMTGTIKRKDGSTQVTYNGWPLYYFKKDQNKGKPKGQDIHGFGGEWYLISPQGKEVEAESK